MWVFATAVGGLLVLASGLTLQWSASRARWGRVPRSLLVIPLLLFLYAASPYVGGRTTGVFTMFSNLRTEADANNHLFMPTADVFGYQDDIVEFVSVSDPELERLADEGLAMPRFQIGAILEEYPEVEITGTRDGEAVRYGPGADTDPVGDRSLLERKVLHFRAVALDGDQVCSV